MWMIADPSSLVNWSVVGGLLTITITLATKWLIPALIKLSHGGSSIDEANEFRELRQVLQEVVKSQTTTIEMLRQRTDFFERQEAILADMLKIIRELEQRSRGQDSAIKQMNTLLDSTAALVESSRLMADLLIHKH